MSDQLTVNGLPLDEWFKYHPPTTDARVQLHASVNDAAKAFAECVLQSVQDERCREQAFFSIQQAKMFANQGITADELRK